MALIHYHTASHAPECYLPQLFPQIYNMVAATTQFIRNHDGYALSHLNIAESNG